MTIADLIKRVEAATGADGALDLEVHMAVAPYRYPLGWSWKEGVRPLHLTASVDAVISLINEKMPGACFEVGRRADGIDACVYMDGEYADAGLAHGATPALALLLAFLRAWEQRGDG